MSFKDRCEKLLNESRLDEVKLSRIWEYVTDPDMIFGVVSAFRGSYSTGKNMEKSEQLEDDIKDMGHGFVKMSGGFVETDDNNMKTEVRERSFLISKPVPEDIDDKDRKAMVDKFTDEIIALGRKYDQDTVLLKDMQGFYEISTNMRSGRSVGQIVNRYVTDGHNAISMAKEIIEKYFSELLYGPHHGRKFVFKQDKSGKVTESIFELKEYVPVNFNPRWLEAARGNVGRWINILEKK